MQSITQTQITKMQMNLNLNTAMTKALVGMVKEYVTEVTTELSKMYGFPLEEALQRLDLENLQPSKKIETKKREKKGEKGPLFMLPYCGATCETWCKAVKYNSGLMTQCTKKPESNEEYCKLCAKTMDATGKPKFGSMHDRDKEGWKDPSGKSPVRYVTVMPKIKVEGVPVTEEQVKEEVLKMGWTMPEEEFMKEDVTDKKNRGRPKKSKPMTSGSVGDDMIANLVSQAKLQQESSSEVSGSESDQEEVHLPADTESKKGKKNDPDDKLKKESEKKEKELKKESEKKEKELKKEAEKKEKELKKEAEKKEKELKKEAEKKEKELKKEAEKKEKGQRSEKGQRKYGV